MGLKKSKYSLEGLIILKSSTIGGAHQRLRATGEKKQNPKVRNLKKIHRISQERIQGGGGGDSEGGGDSDGGGDFEGGGGGGGTSGICGGSCPCSCSSSDIDMPI